MPLQPIEPTEVVLANQVAQRIVQEITGTGTRIAAIVANGIPAQPAVEASEVNGRVIPARPAQAAISAANIKAALGSANCAVIDALAESLGL